MKILNSVLLRRKGKLLIYKEINKNDLPPNNLNMVTTMMKNIESLGFTFDKNVITNLSRLDVDTLKEIYLELVPVLKSMVGANVIFKPMYPNFPNYVMNADEAQLYFNAIMHYISGGTLYPNEKMDQRLPLFDETKVRVIGLGTYEEVKEVFNNLCMSKTSLSENDKTDIVRIFEDENIDVEFPDEIPFKENAALIGRLYIEYTDTPNYNVLHNLCKTATDVLRLVTALSDGDISLATNTKFRKFSRPERRLIMDLLSLCSCKSVIEEDMYRYKNKWIRIGEIIHPKEFANNKRYERICHAFDMLRNNYKIMTFNRNIQELMDDKDILPLVNSLILRPGEFARKLDFLLRNATRRSDLDYIINGFNQVAKNVSVPVLLQVMEHFIHRREHIKPDARVFFPKGSLAKSMVIPNNLTEIDTQYAQFIVNICETAIDEQLKTKGDMGNVYLSYEFTHYLVPFSQRSASKSLKTIVRGSTLPVASRTKAVRAFIWWTNTDRNRVDIDLSAAFFDEHWQFMNHISYTNLVNRQYRAYHSGDITNGGPKDGDGVSEFLDVDIESAVKYGARYVVYEVYNYTNQKFSELPNAMFGWMEREDIASGEIYEPKTVVQKMDLTAESTVAIPVIFDLVNKEFIWCDMSMSLAGTHRNAGGNNLESNLRGVGAVCYGIVNMHKPNLYDLIYRNVHARGGKLVTVKENADIIFDVEDPCIEGKKCITPFDTEVFMSEYM